MRIASAPGDVACAPTSGARRGLDAAAPSSQGSESSSTSHTNEWWSDVRQDAGRAERIESSLALRSTLKDVERDKRVLESSLDI